MIKFFKKRNLDKTKYSEILKDKFPFFYDRMNYVNLLEQKFPDCFSVENDQIKFTSPDYSVFITTREELFILCEILIDKCYDFDFNEQVVVIDVGMNVGFASLFFASKNNVERVIAFEPLVPTYLQALKNFELNSALNDKIDARNYGLGESDVNLDVKYSFKHKGNVGIDGITDNLNPDDIVIENLEIKGVIEVFDSIVELKEKKYLLKIDCEGCEYQIIDSLVSSGVIRNLHFLFIEYHKGNPIEIIDDLANNGFFITRQLIDKDYGIIYATNTNN